MKINIKIVFLSILIALLMYPKTIEFLVQNVKSIYTAAKLNTISERRSIKTIDSGKAKVVFIFDDGWESVYTDAFGVLEKYGYSASISVIPANVGMKGYMTYEQLSKLYEHGWDLLNHSYSHTENAYDNPEGLLSDFNKARQWMKDRQIGNCSDMLIIPYGEVNPYLIKRMKEEGYKNIRTSDNIIMLDKYEIQYYHVNTVNLLTDISAQKAIELALQPREETNTIIFVLHKIEEGDDEYGMKYSLDKFERIVKFFDEYRDKYQVITYSQLFE